MSKNLDHLTTEQKIRHYRGLATLSNGEFREDLYLKILKRAVANGEVSEAFTTLGTYDPDDPRQKSGITPETIQRASEAISVEGSKRSVDDFAQGRGEGYKDDKKDEREKLADLFRKTFDMSIATNQTILNMTEKIMLQHNATANDVWRDFIESSNYLIKSPGSVEKTMPILKQYVNYYKDKDGKENYLGLEDDDLTYILTSYHETHADTLKAYLDLTQIDPKTMTDEQKKTLEQLEKAGGVGALDTIRDMIGGGSNFNVYLYPSEDRKGITFRAYSVNDDTSMEPVSFELSAVIPQLAITWDDLRQRGMNRYKFEVVADMLELNARGTKKFIDDRILEFATAMKGVKPSDIKNYKSKRSGLNTMFFGTEDYPDTLLGWMQGLMKGQLFESGPSGSGLSQLGLSAGQGQFAERGVEFISEMNLLEYWIQGKPRFGKVEVDYFQELLGDLPEDISDEDLHKHLKKEYDRLKAEFDTWDKDFQSAMKEIPNVINATKQTHNAIMSRIPTPTNWGMGSQYVDMPKTPDPS